MKPTVAQVRPLLDFIRKHEARGSYDTIWNGIRREHYPPKPLTAMTIGQVLAWQDSIDHLYMSEASGGYQFMEDTLRRIYGPAGFTPSTPFNQGTQDRLAVHLLKGRGLTDYLRGDMSLNTFAIQVAKEWASMPVPVAVKGHKGFMLKPGQSYYAGDGLNSTRVPVKAFLDAILACDQPPRPKPKPAPPEPAKPGGLFALIRAVLAAILKLFGGQP